MEMIIEIKSLQYFNYLKNKDFHKKEANFQRVRTQSGKVNSTKIRLMETLYVSKNVYKISKRYSYVI